MATTITAGNATNGAAISSDNTGILELKTGTGSGTTAMTVDASQNVGVGTASPSQKLHVYSAGSVYTQVQSTNASTGAGAIYKNATANWLIGAGPASGGSEFAFVDQTNGTGNPGERMRIDSSGNVLVTNAGGGLGYGTGSGGTVTQATNKSTLVTLNKPTGQITMNNAALTANTTVTFQLTNSVAATTDGIVLTFFNGGVGSSANYLIWGAAQSGSVIINVRNISGGSLSEAIVINFAIIKGATS